jgi:hypothetical protein
MGIVSSVSQIGFKANISQLIFTVGHVSIF